MVHLILTSPGRPTSGYDAFISYSHLADDALAATLQAGLETFASPWYRSRTLRVFRDTTNLTATPGLLIEIIGALSVARWFVLVASEQAAQSRWVNDEVSWWLANRDHRYMSASVGTSGRLDARPGLARAQPAPGHKGVGTSGPGMIGYTLPEIRRLLINVIQVYSPDPVHVWPWSGWRGRRQYQARLCHYRRRGYALT